MNGIYVEKQTKFNIKEGRTYKTRCLYAKPMTERKYKVVFLVYNDETDRFEYIINEFKVCTKAFTEFQDYVMRGRKYIDFTENLYKVVGEYSVGECKFKIGEEYPQMDLDDIDYFKYVPPKEIQSNSNYQEVPQFSRQKNYRHIDINFKNVPKFDNDRLRMAITVEMVENAIISKNDDKVYFDVLKPFWNIAVN